MIEKVPPVARHGSEKISGRELAAYLLLSELVTTLVKEQVLDQNQVHHILWNAGMRLYDIGCDAGEIVPSIDSERLKDEGQHLLNLIEKDFDSELRSCSRKRTCA